MDTIISKYIDGTITPEEGTQLNAWLKDNPEELRKFTEQLMFSQELRNLVQAQAQQQAATVFIEEHLSALDPAPHPQNSFWKNWRPISLAASIGILIGAVFSPATWAFVAERKIWAESFEGMATATLPGLPTQPGVWTGDDAQIVGSEHGIKPKSGLKMLRFVSASYPGENSPKSSWSDVYRLVDVRELGDPITERTAIRLSANFCAAPFSADEKYQFNVALYALDSLPSSAENHLTLPVVRETSVATGSRIVPITTTGTWQEITQELLIPPATRFVLIHVAMVQAVPKRTSGIAQFSGHYLDDIRLDLIRKTAH
ncbi:MAG: hypothetical protein WCO60_05650 [Verrucomicrobiota bacterium]